MKKTTKKIAEEFEQKVLGPNVDLSKLDNSVSRIIKDNMERFNECSTKEQVIALCHELFDDAGLDTAWTKKFFYYIGQKKSYVDALQYVVNCYLKGAKLGVIGNRRMYEDDEEKEELDEAESCNGNHKTKKNYTKKQIMESIKYWKKVLESMDE